MCILRRYPFTIHTRPLMLSLNQQCNHYIMVCRITAIYLPKTCFFFGSKRNVKVWFHIGFLSLILGAVAWVPSGAVFIRKTM